MKDRHTPPTSSKTCTKVGIAEISSANISNAAKMVWSCIKISQVTLIMWVANLSGIWQHCICLSNHFKKPISILVNLLGDFLPESPLISTFTSCQELTSLKPTKRKRKNKTKIRRNPPRMSNKSGIHIINTLKWRVWTTKSFKPCLDDVWELPYGMPSWYQMPCQMVWFPWNLRFKVVSISWKFQISRN